MAGLLFQYIQSTTWGWERSRTHPSYSVEGREYRNIWTAMLLDSSNVNLSGTKLFLQCQGGTFLPSWNGQQDLPHSPAPEMIFIKQHYQHLEKCYQ